MMKTGKISGGVAVKRARAGLGLFATTSYKKGDEIIEYSGELITAAERDQRGGRYLFEINDDWAIDGSNRSNIARYINHACKPNADTELDEENKRILVTARRIIKPNEEITINYGKEYFKAYIEPNGCKCATCLQKK